MSGTLLVGAGQWIGGWRNAPYDLVQDRLGEADEQVLRPWDVDPLCLWHDGEPLPRLRWSEVVVELGDDRDEGLARLRPPLQVRRRAEPQRWRDQDRTDDGRGAAAAQSQVGAEGPAQQPDLRQVLGLGEVKCGGNVVPLGLARVEAALAR